MSKQPTNKGGVAAAEAVLADLETKRQRHRERGVELEAARKRASYGAHVQHDPQERKALADVVDETVRHETEGRALDDAIEEAQRRLSEARQVEAKAQDRDQAKQLREALAEFVAAGKACDGALEVFVQASQDMRAALTTMNRLGCSHPSHNQLDSLGALALRTMLTQSSWQRYFERVSPVERKTFSQLCAQWSGMVERNVIAPRLGAQETESADAA
jgi:hypothetical protein